MTSLQFDLQEYESEARAKIDELPARIVAEKAAAAEERRRPFTIVPLVEVSPVAMRVFLESVGTGNVPDEIAECYGTVLRVCKSQNLKFSMRADQLLELLKLKKADK